MISFISDDLKLPTAAITDNKAAVDVIRYPGATKRTLHFDRWLHFARELYLRNKVEIYFAGTELMMADFFTKPLAHKKFLALRDRIMNHSSN